MDLRTSEHFWPLQNGMLANFASLKENHKTEIVIIGAGISGALIAHELLNRGHQVIVLDKRHCGLGSTSASTALLQYEIDTPLLDLAKKVGIDHAVRSYKLCIDAIGEINKIATTFPGHCDFHLRPSFQYTSNKSHLTEHYKEFELRQIHHISNTHWLEPIDVKNKFGISKLGGILSDDGAELDPYKLTHLLFGKLSKKGLRVFNNTEVLSIEHKNNGVTLQCSNNLKVSAKKLIIACGYESNKFTPKKMEKPNTTYSCVSEKLDTKNLWYKNSLIWETANPYLYMRTTSDDRILVGGLDDPSHNSKRRNENLKEKTKKLENEFRKLFPNIDFTADYTWAGYFGTTKDGLPFIGEIKERPHTYFALGFGGNGITYSFIASKIIADLLDGQKNDDAEIFKFNR